MKSLLKARWMRNTARLLLVAILTVSVAAWFFDVRSQRDVIAYIGMSRECHHVWRDLALRRIRAGQTVDDVKRLNTPPRIVSWDQYTLLAYNDTGDFTGLAILARDNKLIFAGSSSCTWEHQFFSTISEQELQDIYRGYWEFLRARKERGVQQTAGGNAR